MWTFLKTGFYSAVVDVDDRDVLVVRARVRDDLVALKARYLVVGSEIVQTAERDYGWRLFTTREAWAEALQAAALDLDYSNFKQQVAECLGDARERRYAQVWATMRGLQQAEAGATTSCSAGSGADSGSRSSSPQTSTPLRRDPRRARRP